CIHQQLRPNDASPACTGDGVRIWAIIIWTIGTGVAHCDCMNRDATLEAVRRKFELLRPLMNERMRRHWAACEALTLQRGGITLVAEATGLSRTTIWTGLRELRYPEELPAENFSAQRVRQAGAGRP